MSVFGEIIPAACSPVFIVGVVAQLLVASFVLVKHSCEQKQIADVPVLNVCEEELVFGVEGRGDLQMRQQRPQNRVVCVLEVQDIKSVITRNLNVFRLACY